MRHDVTIIAPLHISSDLAFHASQMYAKNVAALVVLLAPKGELNLNFSDDIISAVCVTAGGEIRHAPTRQRLGLPSATINRGVCKVSPELVLGIYVFIMAIFVGFEVISRVPSVLHTPLMSGTNAIHGIVVLGAMLVAGSADTALLKALGFIAVVFGAANVFGGFVVTDRMLEMFKKRETAAQPETGKKDA